MAYGDPECYVACIQAARDIATYPLDDDADAGSSRIDEGTRTAARECLRRVFNEIYAEGGEPPDDEDTGA